MKEPYKNTDRDFFLKEVIPSLHREFSSDLKRKLSRYSRIRVDRAMIYVGISTSSVIAGARKTLAAIEEYIEEHSVEADIVQVGGMGFCSWEPLVEVQLPGKARVAFGPVSPERVTELLDGVLNGFIQPDLVRYQYDSLIHEPWPDVPLRSKLPFFSMQNRLLLRNAGVISPDSIIDYMASGGYRALALTLRSCTSDMVCSTVEQSGLRGRGGGGFPTGTKWRNALQLPANERIFICNADESDSGAFMNRQLIETDPFRILEGLTLSAYAIGATRAYIYIRNRYSLSIERLKRAIKQAYDFGLLGFDILESGYNLDVQLKLGPGAYVCGEETALIKSLEGNRGMPTVKPPYPTERGLNGKPTVVNNVETIANIPDILERGSEWFRSLGSESSPGTKIFSINGKARYTVLVEVEMGRPLSTLLELAGGVREGAEFKALHLGGPSGMSLTRDELAEPIDYDKLADTGIPLGSGGVHVLDSSVCMVDLVKHFMHFIRNESCGKCIPCREGSGRMYRILDSITRRPVSDDSHSTLERFKGVIQLETLATVMRDTSLCGLGQTAPRPLLKALKSFRNEFEEHIFDRYCRAGVCTDLRTFYIDVERCTGCTACSKKCPSGAIYGTPRSPYFIVEEKCTGCGICMETCKFSAIHYK